jgi:hypothetical protein
LFIMVALSTLILAPIDQLGCATAWAGVTRAISFEREGPETGPPLAVRISLRPVASCPQGTERLHYARCRSEAGRARPTRFLDHQRTGRNSASLLARPIVFARADAAMTGASPRCRRWRRSQVGRDRRFGQAASPAAAWMLVPASASASPPAVPRPR